MPKLRNRRGAMLVLAAVLLAGLMVMMVLAVDFSRIVSQRNEIHTASDAGSLAGAIQLLVTPTSSAVNDSAIAYAQRNMVTGPTPIAQRGHWIDSTRTFTPTTVEPNAVRVETQRSTNYLLGSFANLAPRTMRRISIAWANAPVVSTTCLKPWAAPYDSLLAKLGITNPNHVLTQDNLIQLQRLSPAARRVTLKHPAVSGPPGPGNFGIVNLPWAWQASTGASQNPQGGAARYSERISGCPDAQAVALSDSLETEPGNIPQRTIDGIIELCSNEGGGMSGNFCLNSGGGVGLPIKVALFTGPWPNGSALVQVRGFTGFVLEAVDMANGPNKGAITGYFDVQSTTGQVGTGGNSTIVRPVLVQ